MTATAALLLGLLATPAPQATFSATGDSLRCVIVDAKDTRRCARLAQAHMFLCVNRDTGEVLGAVQRKTGRPICAIAGGLYLATTGHLCADLSVCSIRSVSCEGDSNVTAASRCLGLL